FGHPRITARLTTPRGLSRPPTSFIGAWCQGIHRMPHSLGHHRNKMLAHTIHKSNNQPHTRPPPDRPTRTQSNRTHPEFAGMAPAETPTPTQTPQDPSAGETVAPSDTQQRAPTQHRLHQETSTKQGKVHLFTPEYHTPTPQTRHGSGFHCRARRPTTIRPAPQAP